LNCKEQNGGQQSKCNDELTGKLRKSLKCGSRHHMKLTLH